MASTPAATRALIAATTSSSDSGATTSPSRSIRSLMPRISLRGTIGFGLASRDECTRSRSVRPAIFEYTRPMLSTSSCPAVVISPTSAPSWVISAFVACVVPCTTSSVSASSSDSDRPSCRALSATASTTPSSSAPYRVSALETVRSPRWSTTTQSVKVPPMSTAMR